jgi:hypothetical protein
MTAPLESFTTPEMVLCANASDGNIAIARHEKTNAVILVLFILSPEFYLTSGETLQKSG